MRAFIVTAIAALAIATPAGAHSAASSSTTCRRDTPAVIGGQHKCLGPGESCALRYERQYERYGFECSRRYDPPRLRRR